MLRILVDQDFDHDILRGLRLHLPDLDVVTAFQATLDRKSDAGWSQPAGRKPCIMEFGSVEIRSMAVPSLGRMHAVVRNR